jgi:IS30 family transposase
MTTAKFIKKACIDNALGSIGYFARPFASWERGFNEKFDDKLRQYVNYKRQLVDITDEKLKIIKNRLSNHPSKRLRFRAPTEMFHQSLSHIDPRT